MKVFILHHHLNTGGVTKVIDVQIDALVASGCTVELIVGSDEDLKRQDIPVHIVKELNYLSSGQSKTSLDLQLESITSQLKKLIPNTAECVIHPHNLCLGKNPLMNLAIDQLLKEGYSVLNHCHDFAEDDRPHLIALFDEVLSHYHADRESLLYPTYNNLRFAAINSMDKDRLIKKGIPTSHILNLPNAIGMPPQKDKEASKALIRSQLNLDERLLLLYPVRVIRRKNIGEFILLATLLKGQAQFLVTQPPKNPEELIAYKEWVTFCHTHPTIPVHFEVGQKADFLELMNSADAIITTSTQEGFGLGFLEPWLYNTPVIGRDLPEITADFKGFDLKFSGLYQELQIEGQEFSQLSPENQKQIIKKCYDNPDFALNCLETLPLKDLTSTFMPELIAQNKSIIEKNYSPQAYGQKLSHFYESSF